MFILVAARDEEDTVPVCSLCCLPIGTAAHDHVDSPGGAIAIHYLCLAMLDAVPDDDGGFRDANPLPWEIAFDPERHALSDTSNGPADEADEIDRIVAELTRGTP